jgi:hypothetical protein
VVVDDDEQQIADLLKQVRRLRSRLATTTVRGSHDEFTAAATPATTYQLTYIPVTGTCLMALNGHVQREGTDYSVNYATGIVTVSATQAASDKITFRYLITDWLVARSLLADTGADHATFIDTDITTTSSSASATINIPAGTTPGDLVLAFHHTVNADTVSTTPAGWTRQGSPPGSSDVVVYSKIAGASEPAATITLTGAQRSTVHSRTYRGTNSIAVQSTVYNRVTSATSCPLGSGSVSGDPTLVMFFGLSDAAANRTSTPTEMVNDLTGVNSALETADGDENLTGVTSIPSRAATCDVAISWTSAAVLVAAT